MFAESANFLFFVCFVFFVFVFFFVIIPLLLFILWSVRECCKLQCLLHCCRVVVKLLVFYSNLLRASSILLCSTISVNSISAKIFFLWFALFYFLFFTFSLFTIHSQVITTCSCSSLDSRAA